MRQRAPSTEPALEAGNGPYAWDMSVGFLQRQLPYPTLEFVSTSGSFPLTLRQNGLPKEASTWPSPGLRKQT